VIDPERTLFISGRDRRKMEIQPPCHQGGKSMLADEIPSPGEGDADNDEIYTDIKINTDSGPGPHRPSVVPTPADLTDEWAEIEKDERGGAQPNLPADRDADSAAMPIDNDRG
jgi:hypothetical protein